VPIASAKLVPAIHRGTFEGWRSMHRPPKDTPFWSFYIISRLIINNLCNFTPGLCPFQYAGKLPISR